MRDFFTISDNACRVPFADLCKRNEEYRTYFVRRTYEASQCIHPQGTKISCFGIVESGILKAVNNTINGVEQCHSYFEAKDLFPEFLYFTGRKNYVYTLIAEKKSTVLWIPVHVLEEMLEIAADYAERMGLEPYYMYRQKNMVGNFENVGYCKPGKEGVYNIQIMEEKQTILAAGAGASTKTVDPSTDRIERVFNVKSIEDYIGRIDEMIERKRQGLPQGGKL